MRKLIIIFSFLGFAFTANAQKADSSVNESIKKIYLYTGVKGKPLIVIDGSIYYGNYKEFNTNDIVSFYFLKPPGSTNIYGKQAADGAILITSKKYREPDTANYSLMRSDNRIYILDGELSNEKEMNTLDPNRILSLTVLKNDKKSISEERRGKTTLIAITRNFAVKQYQKKLSELSTEYKVYLNKHHQSDKGLLFIINGEKYATSTDDRIKKLYELVASDKIHQSFSLNYIVGYNHIPSAVEINAK
jgi:hypothetical protein